MATRRPLVAPAIAFACGACAGVAGPGFPAWLAPLLLLGLSPPAAPAAFALAGWAAASASRASPATAPEGPATIEGTVTSVPIPAGQRIRFLLRASDGRGHEVLSPPVAWPLSLGDRVRIVARLELPPGPRNPGGRDAAFHLAARGVSFRATALYPPVRVAPPSPLATLERARARFAEATGVLPPRERGVVRAIGTGDRGALDPATTLSFARSGLAHVLAVSGFHLVVVAFGLERMLRALLLRIEAIAGRWDARRISAAAAVPVAVVYALATGAQVPVLRAAVAALAVFAGALLDREPEPLNTLALGALALLAAEPGALLDPSLQLSFAAVAGLVLWAGPLRRALPVPRAAPGTWRARLVEPLVAGACATAAASMATAPVLALHFRQVPLLGVLANVVGLPVGSALTVAAALAAAAGALAPALATPFLLAAWPLASLLLALSDAAAAPSWGTLGVGSPGPAGAACALALAVLAGRAAGRRRVALAALAAACLVLPAEVRRLSARLRGGLEVTFLSVGQGDAALLRLPDGSAVLVDGGGSVDGSYDPGARDVLPLLRDLGVGRLAAVFVSHPHPDHALGLGAVAFSLPADYLFTNGDPGHEAVRIALSPWPRPVPLLPGDAWERAGVRFEVSGGERAGLGTNDASLVVRVRYGTTAFLFPGDVEARGEEAAVARGGLRADVVKVPHHGSRTSSSEAFVAAAAPRFAVVSLGRGNPWGFPHAEAIDRWRAAGAVVLRTDEGAIRFLSDGRSIRRVPPDAVLDPIATLGEIRRRPRGGERGRGAHARGRGPARPRPRSRGFAHFAVARSLEDRDPCAAPPHPARPGTQVAPRRGRRRMRPTRGPPPARSCAPPPEAARASPGPTSSSSPDRPPGSGWRSAPSRPSAAAPAPTCGSPIPSPRGCTPACASAREA
ncbi:MAG TPA: DNA internalization-related competence protein ComEC/Rec2 [Anaeromyxobacteraceae bacterium]|nr:DNA internalization-related competence protein ComEC/Rec2 [Anaeromyxobacteraceae bacterium]